MSNPRTDFIRLEKGQEEVLSSKTQTEPSAVASSLEQWKDQNGVARTGITKRPASKSLDAKASIGGRGRHFRPPSPCHGNDSRYHGREDSTGL